MIDPGIALGYSRYGLLPHPVQIAIDERVRKKIIDRWKKATDIIISHFHGDHVPLANVNPYQLSVEKITALNSDVKIWAKSSRFSPTEKKRAKSLSLILNKVRLDLLLTITWTQPKKFIKMLGLVFVIRSYIILKYKRGMDI